MKTVSSPLSELPTLFKRLQGKNLRISTISRTPNLQIVQLPPEVVETFYGPQASLPSLTQCFDASPFKYSQNVVSDPAFDVLLHDVVEQLEFDGIFADVLAQPESLSGAGQDFYSRLCRIEGCVRNIQTSSELFWAFKPLEDDVVALCKTDLGKKHAGLVRTFMKAIEQTACSQNTYRPEIRLYANACWKTIEDLDQDFSLPVDKPQIMVEVRKSKHEDNLVSLVRRAALSSTYQAARARWSEDANQNLADGTALINRLFDSHHGLMVMRLSLGYRPSTARTLSVNQVKADIDSLLTKVRHEKFAPLFANLCGLMLRVTFKPQTGYTVNALFLFDDSQMWNDFEHAEQLGSFWKKVVTTGRGTFTNCHDAQQKYGRVATGLITSDDVVKREHLVEHALGYLSGKTAHSMLSGANTPSFLATAIEHPYVVPAGLGRVHDVDAEDVIPYVLNRSFYDVQEQVFMSTRHVQKFCRTIWADGLPAELQMRQNVAWMSPLTS
jgi:hypothetical protein